MTVWNVLTPGYLNPFKPEDVCTCVIKTSTTFENNFDIKHEITKYLKECCWFSSDQHFLFIFFLKNTTVTSYSQNSQGIFGLYKHKRVKTDVSLVRII